MQTGNAGGEERREERARRPARALALLCAVSLGLPAAAQVGGHPSIAPLAPGAAVPTNPAKSSPYWNVANGWWDKGEAFLTPQMPDVGGALGPDANPQNVLNPEPPAYLQDLLGGWQNLTSAVSTNLGHWVGEVRGIPSFALPTEYVASLEIVARRDLIVTPANRKPYAVVVLSIPPTHRTFKADQAPYAYPGNPNNHGLWTQVRLNGEWWDYPWPGADVVVKHYDPPTSDYDVFGAYIVERCSFRPLLFTMQRYRQLRYVVEKRLNTDFGYPTANIGFLVAGGSYGALPAPLLPMLYPDEFHAAAGSSFHPSLRGLLSDQDSFDFDASLLGRQHSGVGYELLDAKDWTIFCKTEGTDYLGLSLINRIALNRQYGGGHVLRPMYLLCGDVDTTTHGNDWVRLIDPNIGQPGSTNYPWAGRYTTVGSHPVNIYWSVLGKACHGDPAWGEPLYIHPNTNPLTLNSTHDPIEAVWKMVPETRSQISIPISSSILHCGRRRAPPSRC